MEIPPTAEACASWIIDHPEFSAHETTKSILNELNSLQAADNQSDTESACDSESMDGTSLGNLSNHEVLVTIDLTLKQIIKNLN